MDDQPEFEDLPMSGGGKVKTSFFSYMFSLSSVEKNEIINALQYIVLVIVPIVILLKLMKNYIPLENDEKGSIEITVEVVLQLFIIFIAFLFIHKLVVFIPTYSTVPYGKMNLIHIIIPVVFLLLCMKSSISEKLSILADRFMIVSGISKKEEEPKKKEQGQGQVQNQNVQFSQPMLPPPVSTTIQPTYQEPMYQPHGQNNQREQFGISEPLAANELYGLNSY
jgi:hypothetical protein